jgi:hypothetical protein
MPVNNHKLAFRPLIAGTMISSAEVRRAGTIGCFATSSGQDCWAVTAGHVISKQRTLDVPVGQPNFADAGSIITGIGRLARYAPVPMDIAAIPLRDDISVSHATLELGRWRRMAIPLVGMPVIKSGCATGVTRGVIRAVRLDEFEVSPDLGMPANYLGYDQGDSGAGWISVDTGDLIGIHVAKIQAGAAIAVPIGRALAALDLLLL